MEDLIILLIYVGYFSLIMLAGCLFGYFSERVPFLSRLMDGLLASTKIVEDDEEDEEAEIVSSEEASYIRNKYEKVLEKAGVIDLLLNSTAKGWKTSRMGHIDLAILRLAVYEMKYDEEVPVGVAINEAVELAKKYGREESPAFINGILGQIARNGNDQ